LTRRVACDMRVHYETLRTEAARRTGFNQGLGLGLLRQQGIPGWLKAWSKTASLTGDNLGGSPPIAALNAVQQDRRTEEVVAVLVAMALPGCMEVVS
jgi:hypothetical protein